MSETLIEAVARALYDIRQKDDGRPLWAAATESDRLPWIARTENTFAAIEASGYRVVPKKPTTEMLSALYDIGSYDILASDAYAAMLAAAPKVTEGKP